MNKSQQHTRHTLFYAWVYPHTSTLPVRRWVGNTCLVPARVIKLYIVSRVATACWTCGNWVIPAIRHCGVRGTQHAPITHWHIQFTLCSSVNTIHPRQAGCRRHWLTCPTRTTMDQLFGTLDQLQPAAYLMGVHITRVRAMHTQLSV